jgi:oligosaccharide repeat unit polymerase
MAEVSLSLASNNIARRRQVSVDGHIAVQAGIVLITLIVALLYPELQIEARSFVATACWLIVVVTAWAFWSWKRVTGVWFEPYSLFFLSVVLFNASLAFLELPGLNPLGILDGVFSDDTIVTVLLMVAMALASLNLGALVSARSALRHRDLYAAVDLQLDRTRIYRVIGWGMLGISSVPVIAQLLQSFQIVVKGGYASLYQQTANIGISASSEILTGFFLPGILLLLVSSAGSKKYAIMLGALVLIQSAPALVLGRRYAAVGPVLAFVWVWHRSRSRLPIRWLAILGIIFILVISPIVTSTRNVAFFDRPSIDLLYDDYLSQDNLAVSGIADMGGSLRTVAYTVELVPLIRPYDYGVQYGYSLLTVFPNLFWDIHPTVAHGIPAVWLVSTVDPAVAAAGGGMGYSIIAEAYLNFGFWGVPIVLFLTGFLFVKLVTWAAWSNDAARIALLGAYLPVFLLYARSDSTSIMRPLVWGLMIPYFFIHLLRVRNQGA